jgi:hypothetical protein
VNALLSILLRLAMVAVAVAATYYGFLTVLGGFALGAVAITALLFGLMAGIAILMRRVDVATSKGSKTVADALTVVAIFAVAYYVWPVRP